MKDAKICYFFTFHPCSLSLSSYIKAMLKLLHLFLLSTDKLIFLLFFSVFSLEFLNLQLGIVPRFVTWLPELIAIGISLIIAIMFAINKRIYLDKKYLVLIVSYCAVIAIGIFLNSVPAGKIFMGLRVYFKHLPFFLLPAVYSLTETQFKRQMMVVLPLLLLQCPMSLYQRLIQFRGVLTGDVITGTLESSTPLTMILVCSVALLFGFYLKKKIKITLFSFIAILLLVPTTINETKVTLILLPVAFLLPAFLNQGNKAVKIKTLLTVVIGGILFLSVFIPVYDYFMEPRTGKSIVDFFQEEGSMERYLYQGSEGEAYEQIRRGDTIAIAYRTLSKDIFHTAFGLGIGSTMVATSLESLGGDSLVKLDFEATMLAFTMLFWDLGLVGILIYMLFFIFLYKDAVLLKANNSIFGDFALGWTAVILIGFVCLIYTNMLLMNSFNLLFWYFSGVIAAKACEKKRREKVGEGIVLHEKPSNPFF
jgi:hypothetical protein